MARGGSKQRGGMRGGKKNKYLHDKNKGRGKFNQKHYNKQDSSHLKTFGEARPSEDADGEHRAGSSKRRKIDDRPPAKEESSDDEQFNSRLHDPYTQLLSTFSSLDNNLQKKAIESDESEDDTDTSDGNGVNIHSSNAVDVLHDTVDESVSEVNSESDEAHHSDESLNNLKADSGTEYDNTDDEDLSRARPKTKPSFQLASKTTDTELQEEFDVQTSKDEEPDESLDPFAHHFYHDMDDILYETISKEPPNVETFLQNWPVLGQLQVQLPKPSDSPELPEKKTVDKMAIVEEKKFAERGTNPTKIVSLIWSELHVKPQISNNISKANSCNNTNMKGKTSSPLTPLQKELFSLIRNYQDVYFPYRTLTNGEEVRFVYCLHAVNHVLKTRSKIIHHNAKLAKKDDVPEEFRDQGLVRPKVVILVPFRESALRVVRMIIAILFQEEKANVMHMKRFVEEHSGEEISMPKKNPRPEDYEATFAGNTDDTFRIGMTVTKKSLKLYADFYSADIIVASPLGLRVIVRAEGEPDRDFDFLASVELLVLDQTELFLMQNWDHLLHVLDHFHLQPKESHGTDFSRVRSWALNGLTRYYRQTLIFSSLILPEINALFNKKCHNYAGKIRVVNPVTTGTICQVVVQLPQVFHRFDATSATQAINARLDFFVKKILPQFKDSMMSHTMVFIPSYFDFVGLRNYFKREDLSFVQICEYSKDGKVARARDMFFHADAHFLLYSERFHFFRRLRIKGIRHLLFYQPPTFPRLYAEMCNLMHEANQNKWAGSQSNMSVTVLYSKYDVQQLAALVGTDRAKRMITSPRSVHMFMTGD